MVARTGANSWIESRILEKVEFHGTPPPPVGAATAVAEKSTRGWRDVAGSRRKQMRWSIMGSGLPWGGCAARTGRCLIATPRDRANSDPSVRSDVTGGKIVSSARRVLACVGTLIGSRREYAQ
jgi:hypothetical protein